MSQTLVGTIVASSAAVTFVLALGLTPLAMALARRTGYVDRPGGHKTHAQATPYGGGVAIFVAAWLPICGLLVLAPLAPASWVEQQLGPLASDLLGGLRERWLSGLVIAVGGGLMFALGLLDDLRPLGPWPKLAINTAAALLVVFGAEIRVGTMLGAPVSIALTVVWIVVVTNAFNFLDNMDGLSAGVGAICTAFLIVCGAMAGQMLVPGLSAAFLGAMMGFLVFNFPPARVFMGDAGSLLIGYMLSIASVMTSYWDSGGPGQPLALAMPLMILAVPLYDFLSVVVIRALEGRNPLHGDQRHFSHRLVQRGLSRTQAVLTIYLATATTGLAATLLPGGDVRTAVTLLAIVAMVLLIVAILEAPLRNRS